MADKAFVDANVLLRAMFYGMNSHEVCREYIKRLQAEETELWISHHVIREFCVQATHPETFAKEQAPGPHFEKVVEVTEALSERFTVADEDAAVRSQFLKLMREFRIQGKSLHDANIVATMLAHGIDTLITRDRRFIRRFDGRVPLDFISPTDQVA